MYVLIYLIFLYLFTPLLWPLTAYSQPETESDLLQRCAIDLCGPANENPRHIFDIFGNARFTNNKDTTNEDRANRNLNTEKRFNENILPLIEETIQARLEYEHNVLTLLKGKLENPDTRISSEEWEAIALYLYNKEYREDLSFYNDKEKKDILTEAYQEFLKEYESKETELTEEDKKKITLLGQELEKDDFNPDHFAKSLYDLIKKVKTASCSTKPSCKKRVYDKLSDLYQRIRLSQDTEDRINETIKYCRSQYTANMVDALKSKHFKDNLENYKNRFLDRVFSDYSQKSRQAFEEYINETLKITFLSEESIDPIYTDILKQSISRTRQRKKHISLLHIIKRHPMEISNLDNICLGSIINYNEFKHSGFNPIEYTITIGAFEYIHYDYGKQILAHEMAHALSRSFNVNRPSKKSYGKYKKLRECATNRYKENNKFPYNIIYMKPNHDNDKYKTEEDTADLITYKVFQDEPTLFSCTTFKAAYSYNSDSDSEPYDEKYRNQDILIVDPKYFSDGITNYRGSIHSKPLLRTIMEAIHKRIELPPSCQQAVGMYSDRINFEPCF